MRKKIFFALSLLAGGAIFVYIIIYFGGVQDIRKTFETIGWLAVLAYFGNATLLLTAPAASWMILMRGEGLHVSYWTLLKANFMGGALTLITPSFYLGGEPLKMFYVARTLKQPQQRILATIIVAKFQEFGALLLIMIVAVGVAIWQIEFTGHQQMWLVSGMVVILLLFGLAIYAFIKNYQPTAKLIDLVAGLGVARRHLAELRNRACEMDQLIHNAFTKRLKVFAASQAVVLFSAGSIFMRAWIFFAFAGTFLGSDTLCGVYVITNVANSLPMPGGLGAFEGGMAVFATSAGLPSNDLSAFLIVNRGVDVLLALIGLYIIIHLGLHSVARSVAKGKVNLNSA